MSTAVLFNLHLECQLGAWVALDADSGSSATQGSQRLVSNGKKKKNLSASEGVITVCS